MTIDGRDPARQPDWMSIHEAAQLVGVSPATLRRWSDAGEIRTFTTPGGHRRFSRAAIAGLLPTTTIDGTTPEQLDDVRGRMRRSLARGIRQLTRVQPWAGVLDELDRAALEADGRLLIEGVIAALDRDVADLDDPRARAARSAAAGFGALAAGRGIGIRRTVEAFLQLRSMIIRELAGAARRHDLDATATTRWLESATRELDDLVAAVMRGHDGLVSGGSDPIGLPARRADIAQR